MEISRNHVAAAIASTAAVLLIGAAAGWLLSPNPEPPPSEYEMVSNTFGTFLLDKTHGDTWKWFVEHDDDEIIGMGWQFHQKPWRLNTATMENYRQMLDSSP